jgi:hypothetical protein
MLAATPETIKNAWVRIASSVRTSAVDRLKTERRFRHARTHEAMRIQALSEEEIVKRYGCFVVLSLFMAFGANHAPAVVAASREKSSHRGV